MKPNIGKPEPLNKKEESEEQGSSRLCVVKHISHEASKEEIEKVFQDFGEIEEIHFVKSKQCAYLQFKVLLLFSSFNSK